MKIHDLQQVAIIGGGLAGLTLARILQVHGVQAVVYEREALRETGAQPGALALHPDTGQRALRTAELTAVMKSMLRYEAEDLRICDKGGDILWEEVVPAYARNRAEIDGAALRETLLDALYPAVMRWNHQLTRLEPTTDKGMILHFAHGERSQADLVLGADGPDSLVRGALSLAKTQPTGVNTVQLTLAQVHTRQPELARWVGPGSLLAMEDGKGLMAQRHGDDLRIDVFLRVPQAWFDLLLEAPAAAARTMLEAHFAGWAAPLLNLIRCSDNATRPIAVLALPARHRWTPHASLTLLGNAAQMAPWLHSDRANMVLHDAVELADALLHAEDVATGLQAYEMALYERADAATEQAARHLDMCMAPHGAQRLAEWMAQQTGGGMDAGSVTRVS